MPFVSLCDPTIERAATIPARSHNDRVYLEPEMEQVFSHSWHVGGRVDQVAKHGMFLTAQVGNDSIFVLRAGDALRGLHKSGPAARTGHGRRGGRYSARHENGVHHFYLLLDECLT